MHVPGVADTANWAARFDALMTVVIPSATICPGLRLTPEELTAGTVEVVVVAPAASRSVVVVAGSVVVVVVVVVMTEVVVVVAVVVVVEGAGAVVDVTTGAIDVVVVELLLFDASVVVVPPDAATSMVTWTTEDPAVLVAVTEYVADDEALVGVPEIRPELLVNTSPAGIAGVTDHDDTGPPLLEGRTAVMAVPCVKERLDGE